MSSDTAFPLNDRAPSLLSHAPLETQAQALISGDRRMLARAISWTESTRDDLRRRAEELLALCSRKENTVRLGISGPPGVGKSTFIEALGLRYIAQGHKVAVLAVDPSSQRGGGAILADKTRMEKLSASEMAFIRPSPSGRMVGGITQGAQETIALCECAGYNKIVVETVGVGQLDTSVAQVVDVLLLLQQAQTGDELQSIKRGILEWADMVVVNKSDLPDSLFMVAQLRQALSSRTGHAATQRLEVPVLAVSALSGDGIAQCDAQVESLVAALTRSGRRAERRREQHFWWVRMRAEQYVYSKFWQHPRVLARWQQWVNAKENSTTALVVNQVEQLIGDFLSCKLDK